MKILKIDEPKLIEEAVKVLQSGGLIIFPTETAYGVGVDATNKSAVDKLLTYKKRPEGKAISIGCTDEEMASEYVDINKQAQNIYENFLPGPVTVISRSRGKVDDRLESESGTLGIRIPDYDITLKIISKLGKPITTTSANSSGKKTPYSIQDVFDHLTVTQKELVDLVIDAGNLPPRQTSTVVDTTTDELQTHRTGIYEKFFDEKSTRKIETKSVNETVELGRNLVQENQEDLVVNTLLVLLYGDLGAGKTHLVKGVAEEFGITRTIKSPTFNYVSEYKGTNGNRLYHMDAWRVQTRQDLDYLRFDEWFLPGNIVAVEWADILENFVKIQNIEGAKIVRIYIRSKDTDSRMIFIR